MAGDAILSPTERHALDVQLDRRGIVAQTQSDGTVNVFGVRPTTTRQEITVAAWEAGATKVILELPLAEVGG